MKTCIYVLLALTMLVPAFASACEVEDWRFYELASYVVIEGTTTCASGKLLIRAYDGDDNYIGNATAYIEAHTFEAMLRAAKPSRMQIKYGIE